MTTNVLRPTRYTARWVVPVSAPPIADGALLVADGRIAAVGDATQVPLPDDALAVDLGDAVLMPGLVNAHAHPELAVLRGILEDLPFHEWIPRLRRIKTAIGFSHDDWRDAARWTCAESAAAGITAMGATEDSDAALMALVDAGMRGVTFREVFAPAAADAVTARDRLQAAVDEMRRYETDLVRVGVSPHAPYSVCEDLFRLVAEYAASSGLAVAVHAAESEAEQLLVTAGAGPFAAGLRTRGIATPPRAESTIALLDDTGILDLQPLLIHAVRLAGDDIRRIADTGARVAHCPVANARLGHGIAPVVELREAGVTVGIGTDSVASNNRIDLLEEARAAQLMQRARLGSASALAPAELLRMATIDSARALGLHDRVGTLEAGKDADLCAVSLAAVHTRPSYDPVATLFLSARGADVLLTVVKGRVIYRDGEHATLDMAALRGRFDALTERVRLTAQTESSRR